MQAAGAAEGCTGLEWGLGMGWEMDLSSSPAGMGHEPEGGKRGWEG